MARQAILELVADASKLRSTLKDADSDVDSFGKKVGGHMSGIGSAIAGMAKTAAVVGIPAVIGFGVAAVKAFAESEAIGKQTEAVLKSTGGAAKVTAGHVSDLAGKLSMLSGVDDEVIQSGENVLLTFTNIKNAAGKNNDIFDQATKTALDMSVALGTDLQSANIQLGKALNDPIKGITALTRVGVSFTDQQKAQIKALVASGDTLGAQKIILKELQTEFGGSAKAAGETFAGSLNKLKVVAGNFMEDVGSKLVPILIHLGEVLAVEVPKAIEMLRPKVEQIVGFLRDDFVPAVQNIADTALAVFAAVNGYVEDHRVQITVALNAIRDVFSAAWGAIRAVVSAAVDFLRGVWRVFGDDLISFAREAWASIVEVFRAAFNIVSGIFDLIKAVFTGKWGEAWTALKQIIDGAWDAIFGVIRLAVTNVIPTILAGLGQAITSATRTAFDGLKGLAADAANWVRDRVDDMVRFFLSIPGRIANLGKDILSKIIPDIPGAGIIKGVLGHIPGFAAGGVVPGRSGAPMLAMVHGGETITPPGQGGGGGNNYTINVTAIDPRAAANAVMSAIKEYEQRSGISWRAG